MASLHWYWQVSTLAKIAAVKLGLRAQISSSQEMRQSFFNPLAYHLACYHPLVDERIKVALEEDLELVKRNPINNPTARSPSADRRKKPITPPDRNLITFTF